MEDQGRWRVLLKECKGKKVRLILSGVRLRCLLYATVKSESVDRIISVVSSKDWSSGQLTAFLRAESNYVLREVL